MSPSKERKKAQTAEPSFEEALAGLEDAVRKLEAGEVPLEEAMRLFEDGVRLARLCSQRLTDAEKKIEQLVQSEDGSYSLRPFAGPAEEPRPGGELR